MFCFPRFEKWGQTYVRTDGRTICAKTMIPTGRDFGLAESIILNPQETFFVHMINNIVDGNIWTFCLPWTRVVALSLQLLNFLVHIFRKKRKMFLTHEADPQSRPVVHSYVSVPTFQNKTNFKQNQCSLLAKLWVWPSGSLMTSVLLAFFLTHLKLMKIFSYGIGFPQL